MGKLSGDNVWLLVEELLSIFQSAKFTFGSFWEKGRAQKGCPKLASERSDGDSISAGFK